MSPLASYKAFLRVSLRTPTSSSPEAMKILQSIEIHRGGGGERDTSRAKPYFVFSAALIPTMHSE